MSVFFLWKNSWRPFIYKISLNLWYTRSAIHRIHFEGLTVVENCLKVFFLKKSSFYFSKIFFLVMSFWRSSLYKIPYWRLSENLFLYKPVWWSSFYRREFKDYFSIEALLNVPNPFMILWMTFYRMPFEILQ